MAVPEERVGIGHAIVGAPRNPEDRLAAAQRREPEAEAVDLDVVAALDQRAGFLLVVAGPRASGQPELAVPVLRRAERREREDVVRIELLPGAERFEHRPVRKLVGVVAEHRPVGDLAGGSASGADRVEEPARAASGERVEVRGRCRLIGGPPAETGVRAVREPVEEQDDDRLHVAGEARRVRARARG